MITISYQTHFSKIKGESHESSLVIVHGEVIIKDSNQTHFSKISKSDLSFYANKHYLILTVKSHLLT